MPPCARRLNEYKIANTLIEERICNDKISRPCDGNGSNRGRLTPVANSTRAGEIVPHRSRGAAPTSR